MIDGAKIAKRQTGALMRTKLPIRWLLVACLCFPVLSRARSEQTRNVVSFRESTIPREALDAFNRGAELLSKNDAERCLPHFQRAVTIFSNFYEAYYEMGMADLILWRIKDAEQAFRMSIQMSEGQSAYPLFALGAVLDYQGRFAEAEGVIRKGLNLDPTSWSGHFYLGRALFGLNRLEEAEKSVLEALRQKSNTAETLRLLADILAREKNYSTLLKELDEYVKLDPDSPIGIGARALRESAQQAFVESQSTTDLTQPQL
jgi:tetratricopeptide (TPR) repeat protein